MVLVEHVLPPMSAALTELCPLVQTYFRIRKAAGRGFTQANPAPMIARLVHCGPVLDVPIICVG